MKLIRLIFSLVLGCALGFSFLFSQLTAEQIEPINVSNSKEKSDLAQLSVLGNNVFVVWRDKSTGDKDIYFVKSSDEGLSFEKPVNLSDNEGPSAFPRMAIIGDNIYTTWYDYTPGQSDIFFAKSIDNGNSFETINLSDNKGVSYNPWVAAYQNNVYVVWNDETPTVTQLNITKPLNVDVVLGTLDILLATSSDSGSTFAVSQLTDSSGYSWNPRIAVNENNVYVVWNEKTDSNDEIFFSASNDNGKSFSKPINLSLTASPSQDAALKVYGNHVYVIWQESLMGGREIFFTKSDNNGLSFGGPTNISNRGGNAELDRDTQMAVSESNVYVVWSDISVNGGVFLTKSSDNGISFSKPIKLNNFENAEFAQIVLHDDEIYVVWNENMLGNEEVFLRRSHDSAQTFGSIENLSNDEAKSNFFVMGPQIALSENKIYTVFERETAETSDLFLKVIGKNKILQEGTLPLETDNGAVRIELNIGKDSPDITKPSAFELKFLDSNTGDLLENVHYSFEIVDFEGNKIVNNENQQAEAGTAFENVQFSKSGPTTINIDVIGTGVEPPYETKFSGNTSTVITIVPEFPLGFIGVLILATSVTIFLRKFKGY